ncbi:hypothetical protein M9Y10_031636 [Tritrichomonas musculus]|uniref:RING-type domain-containing protein n=1 Tax=Tritrichomonas musculus TaxID=1915356 RepID=A0ABR2H2B1_9EUKA
MRESSKYHMNISKLDGIGFASSEEDYPIIVLSPDSVVDDTNKDIHINCSMKLEFNKKYDYGNHSIFVDNVPYLEIINLRLKGNIYLKNSKLIIKNSTLENPSKGIDYLLIVGDKSTCTVENCILQNTELYGLGVDSMSKCDLIDSKIYNCQQFCMSVTGSSVCSCHNSVIDTSSIELITVEVNSKLNLNNCELKNATNSAIFLYGSTIKAYDTLFMSNGKGAVSIRDSYENLIANCKIVDSNDTAILLENATIVVDGTTINNCNGNGINAQLNSRAIVRNSTFSDAKWPLAAFCDGSSGIVTNTLFEISAMSGFIIRGESDVIVDGCTIRNCAEAGIRISDSRNVKFTNCIITDCQFSGVEICDNSFCRLESCIFAGCFDIGINVYSAASASVNDTTILGPFKSAVWTHHGGYGQFTNVLINNLQLPLKLSSIQSYVAHTNMLKQIDNSPPIVEFFDYTTAKSSKAAKTTETTKTIKDDNQEEEFLFDGEEVNDCDLRFFKVDTKWFVSATHCFIVGVGPYELVANPRRKKMQSDMSVRIPADCIKCGKPANDLHFSPCGHSLYCHSCWCKMSTSERPEQCPICHLPVEKGVQRVNCSSDDNICGICYETPVNTIILPCGHTICKQCAYKWFEEATECPFCREQRAQTRALVSYA